MECSAIDVTFIKKKRKKLTLLSRCRNDDEISHTFTMPYHILSLVIAICMLLSSCICIPQMAPTDNHQQGGPQYTVVAPKKLRPNDAYPISVTLNNINSIVKFTASITGGRDSDKERSKEASFYVRPNKTEHVSILIDDWPSLEYMLTITGQSQDGSLDISQDVKLEYEAKSSLIFIQTDKAIYRPGEKLRFRAIFVTPSLKPKSINHNVTLTIYDSRNNIIKSWTHLSSPGHGVIGQELQLSDQPNLGDWTIEVGANQQVARKQVRIAEYILPAFSVDIKLPKYATYNESEIIANVKAAYTYGKPVQGDVTLTVQPLVRFSSISARPLYQYQYKAKLNDGYASILVNIVKDLNLERDDFEREIEFFALVKEQLTGQKYNKTEVMKIYNKDTKVQLIKTAGTFKPGLSCLILLKVAYQDDSPVEDNGPILKLKYHYRNSDQNETVVALRPRRGFAEHSIRIPDRVKFRDSPANFTPFSLNLVAEYRGQIYPLNEITKSESPSDNYIQIIIDRRLATSSVTNNELTPSFNIGEEAGLIIRSTDQMHQQIVVEVIARGNIIYQTTIDGGAKKELSFTIPISHQMAPMARLVCYYVRPNNGEIVADAINLSVNGLFKSDVKISTSDRELGAGKDIEINVKAKPRSFVGILGIDQSVLLLKSGNDITQRDVTNEVRSYGKIPSTIDGNGVDSFSAKSIFDDSNLLVITNGLLYDGPATREGKLLTWQGTLGKSNRTSRDGVIMLDQLIFEDSFGAPEFHIERPPLDRTAIRDFFPETWLWANSTSGDDGIAHFNSKTPDSITSWVISAFSIDDINGLAIGSQASKVTVFKQFFVKLNLPHSVIRGEIVQIQAIVHNYSKKSAEAVVTMYNRKGEFEFVEAGNTIGEEAKHSQSGQQSTRLHIRANENGVVSFLVAPLKTGSMDIVIGALSDRFSDAVRQAIIVKPEGETQYFNEAFFVYQTANRRWQDTILIKIPANAVPGSSRIHVSAAVDMMAFSFNHQNELLRLPINGGEQNMIKLVPNIIQYNHLKQRPRDMTPENRQITSAKTLQAIEDGYQQQLTYRRDDGSFSEFGNKDQFGSTWLTAYVLKTFHQAKDIITIDNDVMQRALTYLVKHQQGDGNFQELGQLHRNHLQQQSDKTTSGIYLTAYVLIALIYNRNITMKPEISIITIDDAIEKGLSYLERNIGDSSDPYDLAITSYVYQLAGKRDGSNNIFSKLKELAKTNDNFTWWQSNSLPNEHNNSALTSLPLVDDGNSLEREFEFTSLNNNRHFTTTLRPPPLKPLFVTMRHSEHLFVPDSLAIEMTSYALMTIVNRDDLNYATPVVRWLIARQNSNGGFASTQDTVLALEALALYDIKSLKRQEPNTSLDINIDYWKSDNKTGQEKSSKSDKIVLEKANSIMTQTKELPQNTTRVDLSARGYGRAVVQISWQYNLVVSAEEPSFFLNPQLDKSSTEHYLQLSICSYYKAGETSNMVVMEVNLPSGYVADVDALPSITRNKHIKQIYPSQRGTHLSVLFDKMTREEICFTVPAHRSTLVANNKRVGVTIYDYYNRQKAARIFYEPHLLSACEISDKKNCKKSK